MPAGSIEPTEEQIRELATGDAEGPIVMLNLLGFKEDGGREAYEIYGQKVAAHLARVGGRVLHLAEGHQTVIGPPDEHWDMVILVEYPSRQAFLQMVTDPEYLKIHEHRTAALSDSRLICCASVA